MSNIKVAVVKYALKKPKTTTSNIYKIEPFLIQVHTQISVIVTSTQSKTNTKSNSDILITTTFLKVILSVNELFCYKLI